MEVAFCSTLVFLLFGELEQKRHALIPPITKPIKIKIAIIELHPEEDEDGEEDEEDEEDEE